MRSGSAISAWLDGGNGDDKTCHETSCVFLLCTHLCCQYREGKNSFFAKKLFPLCIPQGDCFVLLGDFNTKIGSRQTDDEWWHERGPHGYGELNDAGRELLALQVLTQLSYV